MELMIFDRQLNYVGLIDGFRSFRKVRRYNQAGDFELHVSFNLEVMKMLKLGNIVWQRESAEAGYIEYRNIQLASDGQEMLVVKGQSMSGYLAKRIVWGRENISGTAEKIMRTFVDSQAINPVNPDRKIPLLKLGDLQNYSGSIRKQATYRNLLEVIHEVAKGSGLGFRTLVDVNRKELVFDVYKGRDLSKKVVFSRGFENVLEQEYTESHDNYRNVALIAGTGEGAERKLTSIGDKTALDRLELFVDAKDLQDTKTVNDEEVPIPAHEYMELLVNRGESKLSETAKVESFDSKINPRSNLVYKVDYDLGDIVTVRDNRWGLTVDEQITGIEEVYEEDGFNVFVTFGDEPVGLLEKIKQVVD